MITSGIGIATIVLSVAAFFLGGLECKQTDAEDFPNECRLVRKRSPSAQWRYFNPAYRYFELSRYENLSSERRASTDQFCSAIYATDDIDYCYTRMEEFYGRVVD